MTNKVVLFLPPYQGKPLGPPLSLLALASPVRNAGFEVVIIDAATNSNYLDKIRREIDECCCFGLSLLTGPMIHGAVEASRFVRRLRPDIPIVFGGWHPSLTPEQTLKSGLVDIVVRGQGEITFVELLKHLIKGTPLGAIAGISYKKHDMIFHNPDRPIINLNELPMPAYDLVKTEEYEKVCGNRKTVYASSVGCPYACNYCTDTVFYHRRFNALHPERVVREVTDLVLRYNLEEISFLDSNFLVDVKRAIAIAKGIIDSKVKFRWTFQASTDLLCRMSDEEVCLLGKSGAYHMGFGTESSAEEVLAMMNKPHQKIKDTYETARKCDLANIKVTFNLILGYPGETEAHRLKTLQVMGEIARRYSNVRFSPNVFTPYPGIPVWNQLRQLGLSEPESLEEWADVSLGSNLLPWFQGEEYRRAKRMVSFFVLNQQLRKTARNGVSRFRTRLTEALLNHLDWRVRHEFFGFPLELWLARSGNWLSLRRSLLTGQSLGGDLQKIG